MNAVRLARAFTGRPRIAKFEGAYHGTHDWVLVSVAPDPKAAGSRKRPKPVPASAGVPPAVLKHTVVLPWNDPEACEQIIEAEAKNLAAVLVDPLLGIGGVVPPPPRVLPPPPPPPERPPGAPIFHQGLSL